MVLTDSATSKVRIRLTVTTSPSYVWTANPGLVTRNIYRCQVAGRATRYEPVKSLEFLISRASTEPVKLTSAPGISRPEIRIVPSMTEVFLFAPDSCR